MIRFRQFPRGAPGSGLWRVLALLGLLLPASLAAGNHTRWTTNYYSVTGSTLREIQRSMMHNRPANVDREALTEWSVRAKFSVAKFQGGYRCGGFTTTTTIRMILPRWTAPEGVPESVRHEWERFINALKQHEQGHALFALTTAGQINRRVAEVGIEPDPESLKSRVDGIVAQTIQESREREREYDRLTRHGVEQGAVLAGDRGGAEGRSVRRGHRSWRSDR